MKKKPRVTYQQLGELLLNPAFRSTQRSLQDKEFLKDLGVEGKEEGFLFKEFMIINMYAIVQGSQGLLGGSLQK